MGSIPNDIQQAIDDVARRTAEAAIQRIALEKATLQQDESKANSALKTKSAKKLAAEAEARYQYANTLGDTLKEFENQINVYLKKLEQNDTLNAIEEGQYTRLVNEYQSIAKQQAKILKEADAIIKDMPALVKEAVKEAKDGYESPPLTIDEPNFKGINPDTGKPWTKEEKAQAKWDAKLDMVRLSDGVVTYLSPTPLEGSTQNGDTYGVTAGLYVTEVTGGRGSHPKAKPTPYSKEADFYSVDVVVDKYKEQLLGLYGSQQALVDKLYNAGFLPSNTIDSKTIDTAIDGALQDAVKKYSFKQVERMKRSDATGYGWQEAETMDEYLVPGVAGQSETQTRTTAEIYSDTDADDLTIKVFQAMFGMDPTKKQKKQARPFIQEWQAKTPQVSTITTSGDNSSVNTVTKTSGNPERMLIDELAQTDQAKAHQVLNLYDVFKSTIGAQ